MTADRPHPPVRARAASAGGAVLAGAVRVVGSVRAARKPLHPHGVLRHAVLHRRGAGGAGGAGGAAGDLRPRSGVGWLDEPGTDEAWARTSRAVGLPWPVPDVHGLAVRLHLDDGPADLLLASTGLGRLTRSVLTVGVDPWARAMTTLLPYRGPHGPLVLAARGRPGPAGPGAARAVDLAWARGTGPWHPFATLEIGARDVEDADGGALGFDPVRHVPPGLAQYDVVRRLREPSYATARAQRQATLPTRARPWRSPGP